MEAYYIILLFPILFNSPNLQTYLLSSPLHFPNPHIIFNRSSNKPTPI